MTKILRILNRFSGGGPIYNAAFLSKYISEEYKTILIGGPKEISEISSEYILKDLGIEYHIIPYMHRSIDIINDFKALQEIIAIIKKEKPDIVHTHAAKAGMLGRLAAWYCRVPYIYHTFHGNIFHSYFGKYKTLLFIKLEQFLARKSTAIIAISEQQKKELSNEFKICNSEKIEIVPLGFDLQKFSENTENKRHNFREKYSITDDEIAIGIIGRLTAIKNHTLFLDVIKYCQENCKTAKIRAFIVGDGELKSSLQEYCINNNISFNTDTESLPDKLVTFTSWIQDIDIAYAGLDIVCLTSLNEGTPVSIIESQAAGKPVVATNVGGIEDIVINGKTAFLTDINLKSFSENLIKLITDDNLRATMSKNCSTLNNGKFTYKSLCSNMENVYKKYSQTK